MRPGRPRPFPALARGFRHCRGCRAANRATVILAVPTAETARSSASVGFQAAPVPGCSYPDIDRNWRATAEALRRPQEGLNFSATDASVIQVRKLVTPDPSGLPHLPSIGAGPLDPPGPLRPGIRTQRVLGTSRPGAPQRVTAGGRRHPICAELRSLTVAVGQCTAVQMLRVVRTSGSLVPSGLQPSGGCRRQDGRRHYLPRPTPNRCDRRRWRAHAMDSP